MQIKIPFPDQVFVDWRYAQLQQELDKAKEEILHLKKSRRSVRGWVTRNKKNK